MGIGPTFLCIGCQKAGTAWLFHQLASHPGFRMLPIKELHYFDRGFEWPGLVKLQRKVAANPDPAALTIKNPYRKADAADVAFLRQSQALRGTNSDAAGYGRLFALMGGKFSGDITPEYGALADAQIGGIAAALPEVKIILLVRNPVERAWSALNMALRKGRIGANVPESPAAVLEWLARPEVAGLSFPSRIWRAWASHFPPGRMLAMRFEDIVERPADARAHVLEFLGAPPAAAGAIPPDYNEKADLPKLPMAPAVERAMTDHFAAEWDTCRELFPRM